ncbi:MAG: phosphoribosylanthranilate isomerase [Actinomycetota bacterium]
MGGQPGATVVKICGITTVDDARAAVRAGANAVGFVLAPSPRRVSVYRAHQIARHVHPSVLKFGVFVDAELQGIAEIVGLVGLDAVQLHGSEPPEAIEELRRSHPHLFIVKAFRARTAGGLAEVGSWPSDAVLVDTKDPASPTRRSRRIPATWLAGLKVRRLMIAGGLTPRTVGRLVRAVHPWGVDVSAGVEHSPGRKDHDKVRAFVRAVRRADADLAAAGAGAAIPKAARA